METVVQAGTSDLLCVSPSDSIDVAAKIMRESDVGSLPVMENSKPVGFITDRDIVIRVIAEGKNPSQVKVEDCMTQDVVTVKEDTSLDEAARLMRERKIRRLLVTDGGERPIGMISLGDVAVEKANGAPTSRTLREISQAPAQH